MIPPLTEAEYHGLKDSIVAEGCRDALIVWKDILVDGHNRFKICTEHGLSFQVLQKEFADRDAVKLWMLGNQLGCRNLNDFQRVEMTHKCENAVKARAKGRQGTRTDIHAGSSQAGVSPSETSGTFGPDVGEVQRATKELGAIAGVSRKTYERATTVFG